MNTLLDRIMIDAEIRSGKPVIAGTRITVADILGYLAAGMSEQELLADFPDLVHEDIMATLAFAAQREQQLFAVTAVTDDGLQAQAWQVQDICAALAEADRGEFASDEEVNRFFAKYDR
jgi:uncharacterized protein (DUF433 family)